MNVDQLDQRRERIRLPVSRLAELAGRDKHTVHRMFDRSNSPRLDTFDDVRAALETEERALLAHLSALHGPPGSGAA